MRAENWLAFGENRKDNLSCETKTAHAENEVLKSKNGNKVVGNTHVNSVYEVIGKLSIGFSQLEYLTEQVLTLMIAQNDFMVEPLLVRPLSFPEK